MNTNPTMGNGEFKIKKRGRGRPPKVPLLSTSQVLDVSSQVQVSKSPIKIAPRPGSGKYNTISIQLIHTK